MLPVVVGARRRPGAVVSIDTMRAEVAAPGRRRPAPRSSTTCPVGWPTTPCSPRWPTLGVAYIAMHWRGHSASMQQRASYDDVVGEVTAELAARAAAALAAGIVPADRLALDPGIGFAKLADHNWTRAAHGSTRCTASGFPLVVGSSRKSFLGALLADRGRAAAPAAGA